MDDGPRCAACCPAVRGLAPAFVAAVEAELATVPAATARAGARGPGRGTTVGLGADGELVESLTARELEVLRVLATGVTNAELAAQLGVSPGTAKWHVAHILAKLGTRSRTAGRGPGAAARADLSGDRRGRPARPTGRGANPAPTPPVREALAAVRGSQDGGMDRYELRIAGELGEPPAPRPRLRRRRTAAPPASPGS